VRDEENLFSEIEEVEQDVLRVEHEISLLSNTVVLVIENQNKMIALLEQILTKITPPLPVRFRIDLH